MQAALTAAQSAAYHQPSEQEQHKPSGGKAADGKAPLQQPWAQQAG